MKILVVDDDPAILKLAQKLLELQGWEIGCCDNALDAIQTLGDMSYDVLITDATMPAYSGFDLIRTIRKTPELNYLTIAMLTGRSEKSDIEQALKLGVQDYIVKPIDPALFLEKASKLVSLHERKKQQKPKSLQANAEMVVPIEIGRITDVGITIEGPYPLVKGTIVTIRVDELIEAGIIQNQFKAIFNNLVQKNGRYSTELLLMNLTAKEQQLLSELSKKWTGQQAS